MSCHDGRGQLDPRFVHHFVVDHDRAQGAVDRLGDPRYAATAIDATNPQAIVDLARIEEADVILNACDPRLNPPIFQAAFEAGCTYIDMAATLSSPHPEKPHELTGVKLGDAQFEKAGDWEAKAGLSANEYMAEAVEEKIARESGDYDVPSFMDKRFSQIIDELKALSTNVASLEVVTVAGNDTIMNLTRGDSYLLDDDDGELASAP